VRLEKTFTSFCEALRRRKGLSFHPVAHRVSYVGD
jgi:hypothetical protein